MFVVSLFVPLISHYWLIHHLKLTHAICVNICNYCFKICFGIQNINDVNVQIFSVVIKDYKKNMTINNLDVTREYFIPNYTPLQLKMILQSLDLKQGKS